MTYRHQRLEIKKEGTNELFPMHEVQKLRDRLQRIQAKEPAPGEKHEEEPEPEQPRRPSKHVRVYLYLQLQQMINIPEVQSRRLKLRLSHAKNKVSLLKDHVTPSSEVEITDVAEFKPTFTITIDQDNVEHMNTFSDNPLRLMLYEMDTVDRSELTGVSESDEDHVPGEKLVAEGLIDLLPFFTKQRKLSMVDIFLYPKERTPMNADHGTCKTTWQIYSLLPLLKNMVFSNMVFITFESIYNAPQEITDMEGELVAELYFQSKLPNEENEFDKQKICDFRSFHFANIANQNRNTRWESLTLDSVRLSTAVPRSTDMSANSGTTITHPQKILDKLLCSEGLHQHLQDVSVHEDEAMVCNTVRRYMLTHELNKILEDVVAFNEQEILIEIHNTEEPDNILLRGAIDLSVFLYPRVNACRFAVALSVSSRRLSKRQSRIKPSQTEVANIFTTEASKVSSRSKKKSSASYTAAQATYSYKRRKELLPFAIVNICLNTPITEKPMEKRLGTVKLANCEPAPDEAPKKDTPEMTQEHYKDFDELIREMIDHIIKHDIKVTDDCHSYFCSQLGNLTNKILKLVQFDFNVRVPTKDTIEFTNLMTLVYKELVARIYGIIRNCDDKHLQRCIFMSQQIKQKILELMNHLKYCREVRDNELTDVIMRRLEKLNEKKPVLDFYLMLMDLEYDRLEPVKLYLTRPIKDRYMPGEYITGFIRIYVRYFETQVEEVTYNAAFQYLLYALKEFSNRNPSMMEPWILLYCLYKMKNYAPGVNFTRWKFESMFNNEENPETWVEVPKSRWDIYYTHKLSFDSLKGKNFFKVTRFFCRYGMYAFGEIVFREVASESKNDIQKYCINNMFRMMQREILPRTNSRNSMSNDPEVQASLVHLNGHLEFYRGNEEQAMNYYESIVMNDHLYNTRPFDLGILRYAYFMQVRKFYERAAKAFKKLIPGDNSLAAFIGLGKAHYKLNKYKDAEKYFAESTKYRMHIPDVWAYLALINLKRHKTYQALESWKYAKIRPNAAISEEIINELNTIDREDCNLCVDLPCLPGVEDPTSPRATTVNYENNDSKKSLPGVEALPLFTAAFNEASTSAEALNTQKQNLLRERLTRTDVINKEFLKLRRR